MDVGLIPCADGGTCLEDWQIGGLLYDHAVMQARLAQRTSLLRGILWHQGEGDCTPERYPLYEERLTLILQGFRRDLCLPEVPILVGGLGDFLADRTEDPSLKNYVFVNQALQDLAAHNAAIGFVRKSIARIWPAVLCAFSGNGRAWITHGPLEKLCRSSGPIFVQTSRFTRGKPPEFLPEEIIPAALPANRRAGKRHFQKTVRRQSRGAREKAGMDAPEYCRWRWRFPHLPRINERFALRYRLPRT